MKVGGTGVKVAASDGVGDEVGVGACVGDRVNVRVGGGGVAVGVGEFVQDIISARETGTKNSAKPFIHMLPVI